MGYRTTGPGSSFPERRFECVWHSSRVGQSRGFAILLSNLVFLRAEPEPSGAIRTYVMIITHANRVPVLLLGGAVWGSGSGFAGRAE